MFIHFIFSPWLQLARFENVGPERLIILMQLFFFSLIILFNYCFLKFDSESEASTVSEIGELALQSTISSVDNQEDCNQQRLLVDSDKTCEKNSSSQEAEELEIFVRDADSETKEDGRNCCGCKSWQCTRYGCCRCFRNSKIAVLLR